MPAWTRKHDLPGSPMSIPRVEHPTSLEQLIELCRTRPPDQRMHAAGSHWALSTAAVADHIAIETNDPPHTAMGKTLYDYLWSRRWLPTIAL
jgi:hypothetical protein